MSIRKYKTIKEGEEAFLNYLHNHVKYVNEVFEKYGNELMDLVISKRSREIEINRQQMEKQIKANLKIHDHTKFTGVEFKLYREAYFVSEEDTFNESELPLKKQKAFEMHHFNNPHHIEYWYKKNKTMPNIYYIEMICDNIGAAKASFNSQYDYFIRAGKQYLMNGGICNNDINIYGKFLEKYKKEFDFTNNKR